jgi:hypothetical protein
MQQGVMLGNRIIKRAIMHFSIVIVNALSRWTQTNMSAVQGMCLIALIFVTAIQLNNIMAQPKLIRLVCLLYCNQQVRRLFTGNTDTLVALFPNIILAFAIAVLLVSTADKNSAIAVEDLRYMLEGLLYMYGDIMDFMFKYGVLPVTVASLGMSLVLKHAPVHPDPMRAFIQRLLSIVSTNILYQGISTMINATTQAKLIESVATTSILRLMIPSMEGYLTYLTAVHLTILIPGMAPILACLIIWTELVPASARGWVSELLATYVIQAVITYLISIPTWGAMVVLIVAYYIDFIVNHLG